MKKNLYYRSVMKRENVLANAILGYCFKLSSYPRLLIEVFIRKNFGHRYYRDSSAASVAIIMAAFPFLGKVFKLAKTNDFWTHYSTWYIYLIAFIFFCFKHSAKIKREKTIISFDQYSLKHGETNDFFRRFKINGEPANTRFVETVLEPLPFLIGGILLALLHQYIGGLLIFCSIIYSLSYVAAYRSADNYFMDISDEMIANREMESVFVNDAKPEEASGFSMPGRKPVDPQLRRKMLSMMRDENAEPAFVE